jgi:hypothetical protein
MDNASPCMITSSDDSDAGRFKKEVPLKIAAGRPGRCPLIRRLSGEPLLDKQRSFSEISTLLESLIYFGIFGGCSCVEITGMLIVGEAGAKDEKCEDAFLTFVLFPLQHSHTHTHTHSPPHLEIDALSWHHGHPSKHTSHQESKCTASLIRAYSGMAWKTQHPSNWILLSRDELETALVMRDTN